MITTRALISKFQYALDNNWGYIWGTAGVLWTKAKQEQLDQTTDADRERGRKYGSKWIGHTVADCSGLFAWAFSQLGGKMYHGSNTMWDSWCIAKGELKNGKRSDGKTLKPGSAVFTYNDTTKKRGHVGLYIGNGYVIEAESTIKGVVMSKITLKKWVEWGELKGVDDSASESVPAGSAPADGNSHTEALPTLKRGSKGEYVTLLQTKLVNKGYSVGSCGIDGDFGQATLTAVKQFQKDHGLKVDGIVGAATWAALNDSSAKIQLFTVTVPHLTETEADAMIKTYQGAYKEKEVG